MLRHNLLLIYRSFKRFKSTFFINLIGLSTGLAFALLIFLWVRDELSVDRFHEKDNRLVEVLEIHNNPDRPGVNNFTAGILAEALAEEMPEVEYAVASMIRPEQKTFRVGENYLKATVQFASRDFFNLFSYELIHGDKDQVLNDKSGVVISEKLSMSLFNTPDNVVGKVIEIPQYKQFQVSGIFKGPPANSTAQFDFILSFEAYKELDPNLMNYNYNKVNTYLTLNEGVDVGEFNSKIANFLDGKRDEAFTRDLTLSTRPFSDAYLYSYTNYENGEPTGGRIEYVWLFSIIGALILAIACINFMKPFYGQSYQKIEGSRGEKGNWCRTGNAYISVFGRIYLGGFFIHFNCFIRFQ